ncbi:hypothetical protein NF27_EY00900 [Candidatus Jidaibacter acanthamoeba]|uniref:Uncharacterized protein n=1 Tax=Candidatus Jidaibacter acanthamoebae TaxID=86105 RepID=A0A0C1QHL4_9RICK|nr:hypothetical protein [Candidatus Jidaibacter acanthamoeba]KIE04994.1 hypothetical protein NF27_EY00900 [Candidatus Jidaibacter acanthamoeba]
MTIFTQQNFTLVEVYSQPSPYNNYISNDEEEIIFSDKDDELELIKMLESKIKKLNH